MTITPDCLDGVSLGNETLPHGSHAVIPVPFHCCSIMQLMLGLTLKCHPIYDIIG